MAKMKLRNKRSTIKYSNYQQNTSSLSVRSSNTFNKNINKHLISVKSSRLLYTNLQSKTQCAGFFNRTYKTKPTTDGSFLLGDCKKVSTRILFQKVCLSWKLSPITNRWGVWNKNVLGGKKKPKK